MKRYVRVLGVALGLLGLSAGPVWAYCYTNLILQGDRMIYCRTCCSEATGHCTTICT